MGGGQNHRVGGPATGGAPTLQCTYCGKKGHNKSRCYKLQRDKDSKQGTRDQVNQAQVKEEDPTLFSFVAKAPPAENFDLHNALQGGGSEEL